MAASKTLRARAKAEGPGWVRNIGPESQVLELVQGKWEVCCLSWVWGRRRPHRLPRQAAPAFWSPTQQARAGAGGAEMSGGPALSESGPLVTTNCTPRRTQDTMKSKGFVGRFVLALCAHDAGLGPCFQLHRMLFLKFRLVNARPREPSETGNRHFELKNILLSKI